MTGGLATFLRCKSSVRINYTTVNKVGLSLFPAFSSFRPRTLNSRANEIYIPMTRMFSVMTSASHQHLSLFRLTGQLCEVEILSPHGSYGKCAVYSVMQYPRIRQKSSLYCIRVVFFIFSSTKTSKYVVVLLYHKFSPSSRHARDIYHIVGRAFIFGVHICPCPLSPAIVSLIFPRPIHL
jgi:hypothetical protein